MLRGRRRRRLARPPLRPGHGAADSRLEHDRHGGVVRGGVLVSRSPKPPRTRCRRARATCRRSSTGRPRTRADGRCCSFPASTRWASTSRAWRRWPQDLAAGGYLVMTLALPDLMAYSITTKSPDVIEDAVAWMAKQPELARRRQGRHRRHQLRRRAVDVRRRPPVDPRQGGVRAVVRRPRRHAAGDEVPGHRRGTAGARARSRTRRTTTASRSSSIASRSSASCRPIRCRRCATASAPSCSRRSSRSSTWTRPTRPSRRRARWPRRCPSRRAPT